MSKLLFNGVDYIFQSREVSVMNAYSTNETPDSFNRVQLRTIRREKIQGKSWTLLFSPFMMKFGVVISGIVQNKNYSLPVGTAQ